MTAEERLARAFELFERVDEQFSMVTAQLYVIRDAFDGDPDPNALALNLSRTGCKIAENWADMYALRDMLKPEEVAA